MTMRSVPACAECHGSNLAGLHGGNCETCHNPNPPVGANCITCHPTMVVAHGAGPFDFPFNTNYYGYVDWTAAQDISSSDTSTPHGNYTTSTYKCAVCHSVHKAKVGRQGPDRMAGRSDHQQHGSLRELHVVPRYLLAAVRELEDLHGHRPSPRTATAAAATRAASTVPTARSTRSSRPV